MPNLSRQQAKYFINEHGGKVTNTVSKKTNYLVMGKNPGSKLEKAHSLNVAILDERGLLGLVGENENFFGKNSNKKDIVDNNKD